jgi:tetratricopeptide (TPR) repeat protein
MHHLRLEHAITAAVALGLAGLALAEGGFAPTAYAATAALVWGAVVIGLATGVLPRSAIPGPAIVAGLMIGGFAALTGLSIAWAADNGRAFEDVVRALAYVGIFVLVVIASRLAGAAVWLRGLAIGLVAIAAIALLARFEPGLFGNPDAELREVLPAAGGRLTYPIGYWNGLAAAMASAVVLFGWIGATGSSRLGRGLAVAALPAVVLALWATDSRGGIVAAGLGFAALVAFGPKRLALIVNTALGVVAGTVLALLASGRDDLFENPGTPAADSEAGAMLLLTLAAVALTGLVRYALDRPFANLAEVRVSPRTRRIAVAVAVAGLLAAIVAADPIERFETFKAPPSSDEIRLGRDQFLSSGGSGRYQFWETAIDAFAEAPIGGQGSGGYGPYWLEHRDYQLIATRAHSLAFESLAELGLAGFALVVGFLATAVVTAVRRRRARRWAPELGAVVGVLTVGVLAAAVDWTWDLPAVFALAVVAVALLVGPATLPTANGDPPRPPAGEARSRRRFAGGVSVLLVAWIAICAAGLLLLADRSLESSREAASRGDLEAAIEAAADARDLEPWSAEPRTQLALLYERAGEHAAALESMQDAIERAPRDFELYLVLARLQFTDGDLSGSWRSVLRARELNPLDPLFDEDYPSSG